MKAKSSNLPSGEHLTEVLKRHPNLMWEVLARCSRILSPWINDMRTLPNGDKVASVFNKGFGWSWHIQGWAISHEQLHNSREKAQAAVDAFLVDKGFILLNSNSEHDPRLEPREGDLVWLSDSPTMRGVYKREEDQVFYENNNGDCLVANLPTWRHDTYRATIILRGS